MQWSELISSYRGEASQVLVLVTLAEKEGSHYRQPGVRFLKRADEVMTGCGGELPCEDHQPEAALRI